MKSSFSMTRRTKRMKDQKADELRRERKACLARADLKMAQIAREMELAQSTVQTVINLFPQKKSSRVQEYLAVRLGEPYEKLWGTSDRHGHSIPSRKRVVNE